MASQLMSSLPSFKKFLIVLRDISKSESLKSYLTLKPKGPYFLLYWIKAWKNAKLYSDCNHYFFLFGQAERTYSFCSFNDREMFGLMPLGGYRVILSAFWRIFEGKYPTGILLSNSLNDLLGIVFYENPLMIFYSYPSQLFDKWQLLSRTQDPSFFER